MLKIEKVLGSAKQAKPLIIIGEMVYIHKDIVRLDENLYSYEEYQLSLSEFLTKAFSSMSTEDLLKLVEVND